MGNELPSAVPVVGMTANSTQICSGLYFADPRLIRDGIDGRHKPTHTMASVKYIVVLINMKRKKLKLQSQTRGITITITRYYNHNYGVLQSQALTLFRSLLYL